MRAGRDTIAGSDVGGREPQLVEPAEAEKKDVPIPATGSIIAFASRWNLSRTRTWKGSSREAMPRAAGGGMKTRSMAGCRKMRSLLSELLARRAVMAVGVRVRGRASKYLLPGSGPARSFGQAIVEGRFRPD